MLGPWSYLLLPGGLVSACLSIPSVLLCLSQAKGTHHCRSATPRPPRAPRPRLLPDRSPVPRASLPLRSAALPCPRALRPSSAARPPRLPARRRSHSAARPCRRRASHPARSAVRLCHPAARPRSPGRHLRHRGRGRWPSVPTPSRPATTPRPVSRAAAATRSWQRGRPTRVPPPPGCRQRPPHSPSPAPMATSSMAPAGHSALAEPSRASACALRSSRRRKRNGPCPPARPVPKRAPSAAPHSVRASPSQSRLRPPPMPTLNMHSLGHPST